MFKINYDYVRTVLIDILVSLLLTFNIFTPLLLQNKSQIEKSEKNILQISLKYTQCWREYKDKSFSFCSFYRNALIKKSTTFTKHKMKYCD